MRENSDLPLLRFILIILAIVLAGLSVAPPVFAGTRVTRYFRRDSDHDGMPGPLNYPTNYSESLLNAVNEYRIQHGLPTLEEMQELMSTAEKHSRYMYEQRKISHDNFYSRFQETRARLCVENVATGTIPKIKDIMKAWIASPEHHRNLLEPKITKIGISYNNGYITYFACQVNT